MLVPYAELKFDTCILYRFSDSGCLHSYALSEMISGGSSHRRSSVRMATKDNVVLVSSLFAYTYSTSTVII